MNRRGYRSDIAAAIFAGALLFAAPATAQDGRDVLDVTVDQATVIKMPERVATIVVGNPLIADVSLQSGGMLVVTGKGYGSTNVVALDRSGDIVMDRSVRVHGPHDKVVVVYRGVQRETYSCQPKCEQRITLGDAAPYFSATMGQTSARTTQAQSQQTPAQ